MSYKDLRTLYGNCTIVVVPQGFVGLATDMGQPVLLPPGMHQWKSDTMKFEKRWFSTRYVQIKYVEASWPGDPVAHRIEPLHGSMHAHTKKKGSL